MAEGVRGAEQLSALAKRFREAGRKDLTSELYRGINRATKPLKAEVKAKLPEYMPAGYVRVLQPKLKLTTSKRTSAKAPGVIIRARANNRLDRLDAGELRHPLFGIKRYWFDTNIKPGFFSETLMDNADEVKHELQKAMDDVAKKIEG